MSMLLDANWTPWKMIWQSRLRLIQLAARKSQINNLNPNEAQSI